MYAFIRCGIALCLISSSVKLEACFWRHGNRFIHPHQLIRQHIPFTVHVQQVGDIVLVDGRALVQSWDTGPNVVASLPFLDSHSATTIVDRIASDKCWRLCQQPPASHHNAIVDALSALSPPLALTPKHRS